MITVNQKNRKREKHTADFFKAVGWVALATLAGSIFRYLSIPETNIVVVYILSVLLAARFTKGYTMGIAAAVMATCLFNYFFAEPYLTLSVNDPTYFITFAIMTLTSIITSALTSKVKQTALEAQEKEMESSALYKIMNYLTDAADLSEIAGITVKTVSDNMNCCAAFLCFDENGNPEHSFIQQKEDGEQIRRNIEGGTDIKYRMVHLRTDYYEGEEFYDWPIYGREELLGVLRIPLETASMMTESQFRLLHSIIESTSLAMDRFRSVQARIKSREEVTQERYRGNLLRAISHDLRTPLSGIMGASEMLMSLTDKADGRYALEEGIYKDAYWLHSMVENILSLTRLQEGKLVIKKQMEAVEEIVGAAVIAIEKRAPERDIAINIPDNLLMVPMDAKLINQVLINLLDNAVKHTKPDEEISVSVEVNEEENTAVFVVADCGAGIPKEDLPRIFQMFYTTGVKGPDSQRGVGLGLAICESIVNAHGGRISAGNRKDRRGAEFVFSLPLEVE
ncbi:MAG: DUF4118 domain-containing protein [Bacillota bacterium]|nr:DUF4118 domain-containing protein [Bacillota bacterium]